VKRLDLIILLFLFIFSCSKQENKKKEKSKKPVKQESIDYNKAYDFREAGKADSAFKYYLKARDFFLEHKDSLGVGKCLVNLGMISTNKGDYYGGHDFGLDAIAYFNDTIPVHKAQLRSNFNNLGLASHHLGHYQDAISFYQQALKYTNNINDIALVENNIANSFRRLKDYPSSLTLYESALKKKINSILFAKILSNFAFTKWLQNSRYNPVPELLQALNLQQKDNNLLELNASYSHLSDYYATNNQKSAVFYADKMYVAAKRSYSTDDQLQALEKLITLSSPKQTKSYFEIYHKLDDSVEISRTLAKNQFAFIRYQSEKFKADFLKAQSGLLTAKADNVQKQNGILKRNILVGILVVLLIFGYLLYRRRRKRLQQEKELEVKNTELKYVKKIHDRVANKVYNVMSEVENTPDMDKDHLLDKLDVIYHISRDISYERNEDHDQFASALAITLKSYASAAVDITVSGNDEELWLGINDAAKSEVVCILQELMTNMKKHSRAENVDIRFERKNNRIDITYFDDGIGMKAVSPKNGLQNTETRIQSILGSITFDNTTEKGLKILISFPLT